MEKELDSKVFMINDYASKNNMEEHIKEYIRKLRQDYPSACITREFYKGENILVRATEVYHQVNFEILSKRLRELAFLNKGINIELYDKRTGKRS